MEDSTIITALVTALPATVVAFMAWRESRNTHTAINSRMDELLEETRKSSQAKGKSEGKLEERQEVFDRNNKDIT